MASEGKENWTRNGPKKKNRGWTESCKGKTKRKDPELKKGREEEEKDRRQMEKKIERETAVRIEKKSDDTNQIKWTKIILGGGAILFLFYGFSVIVVLLTL